MKEITVFIYAFFLGKRIVYAGQTADAKKREYNHRKSKSLNGAKFRILRTCPESSASRIERQIVLALQKRGQCDLNKIAPSAIPLSNRYGNYITYQGQEFSSWAELARHCGCCVRVLKNRGIIPNINGGSNADKINC